MGDAWIVARGVDTLVLNVFYLDEIGKKRKRELDEERRMVLEGWKKDAVRLHDDVPTALVFNDKVLHMAPNGAGRGQWPYMLKTADMTFYVSGGQWNGIASIRLSSQYLWSSPGALAAIKAVQSFVDGFFGTEMYLQLSLIDLCVDIAGWSDVASLDRGQHFVTRSRKGGLYDEGGFAAEMGAREYMMGLQRTGFDFGRSGKGVGALSCRLYDKTREVKKSGKEWLYDLWYGRGWSEVDGPVWRVEFSFKREALHELRQEVAGVEQFHGIEDAYEVPDRLPLLWAYAAGQVEGGPDGLPDGWLRCVLPGKDKNRARWQTHPAWKVVQGAFLEEVEVPPQFGKVVRKRWERHNINEGVEAVIGYLSSLAAWAVNDVPMLARDDLDLSMVLHWLAGEGEAYLTRVERDFTREVQRKRIKFGVSCVME